jgi:cell division septum initiation protein DivIVA
MIKFVTDIKHRFGKEIGINGKSFKVDSKGVIEVDNKTAAFALLAGFKPVDKDAKFESMEEQEATNQIADMLAAAEKKAEAIIENAKAEAEKILEEARNKAIIQDSNLDEKKELLEKLNKMTVEQLRDELKDMQVPEEEYKNLNKAKLVELVFSKSYEQV